MHPLSLNVPIEETVGLIQRKMKLHLLRHAKTEILSVSRDDFQRKLLPKGIIQSNMMGQFLLDQGISPEEIFCSQSVRTKQTLQVVAHFMNYSHVHYREDLYLAAKETYLNLIWTLEHSEDILIIGHNEGISELASYLTGEEIQLKTSGFISIDLPGDSWKDVSVATGTVRLSYRPQVFFPE